MILTVWLASSIGAAQDGVGHARAQVDFADVHVAVGDEDAILERLAPHVFMGEGLTDEVLAAAVAQHATAVQAADRVALRQIIAAPRARFHVGHVTVVSARGTIGEYTIGLLTQDADAPFDCILGCRMRKQVEVKDVVVNGRRYAVCRNPIEAEKDKAAREAIVAKLEGLLAQRGPKAVIGNSGFARFLKIRRGSVSLDQQAIANDARLDGKFVLTTNTWLSTAEVALASKSLWRVERTSREEKSTLEVRPIDHQLDSHCIGDTVGCFLALRLEVDLQRRLDERPVEVSWPELMRALMQVQAVTLDLDGKRYRLRTDLAGCAHEAFPAVGVRPPPPVSLLGTVADPVTSEGPDLQRRRISRRTEVPVYQHVNSAKCRRSARVPSRPSAASALTREKHPHAAGPQCVSSAEQPRTPPVTIPLRRRPTPGVPAIQPSAGGRGLPLHRTQFRGESAAAAAARQ